MRSILRLGLSCAAGGALALFGALSALSACGSDAPPSSNGDASADSGGDGNGRDVTPPPQDATTRRCMLDNGADPVALCTQKELLRNWHQAALTDAGVVSSWDSTSFKPDLDEAGAPRHSVDDDLIYAVAAANYHDSAAFYGDSEETFQADADLRALAALLVNELATPPTGYAGEIYFRIRRVAQGVRQVDIDGTGIANAMKLDAIADAYGKNIFTFAQPVRAGQTVLGESKNGSIAYRPPDVASGAYALIDMASRHHADDPANAAKWEAAATGALSYMQARGRDPVTGLFFTALVTSGDPDHDALDQSPSEFPSDALLADTQASVLMALLRAAQFVQDNGGTLSPDAGTASYPFEPLAESLLAALDPASSPPPKDAGSDATTDAGDAGDAGEGGPPPSAFTLWDSTDGGAGYYEGYVPSRSALLTDKPTRANALLWAATHRVFVTSPPFDAGPDTPIVIKFKALRTLLTQALPPNGTLLSVVPNQASFFRACTKDFMLPQKGTGGTPPGSYETRATGAALEGMDQEWFGYPGAPFSNR